MPEKRLFENTYECAGSPMDIKRTKFYSIEEFRKHCDALATKATEIYIEGLASAAASRHSTFGNEGEVLKVNPLRIWMPNDFKHETTKPLVLSHGKVDDLEKKMIVKNSEMETLSQPRIPAKDYLPPSIIPKEGHVSYQFPSSCKANEEKVQNEVGQVISKGNCELVGGKAFSDCNVEQEEDEVRILSLFDWNLMKSGSKFPMACDKNDGVNTVSGIMGKDPEKGESGSMAQFEEVKYFDLASSFLDGLILEQQGKRAFDCELTESKCGEKGKNHELVAADRSESLFLKQKDESRVSGQNSSNDKSLFLRTNSVDQRMTISAFDNDDESEYSCEDKESNEWGIVPFDEYPEIVCRNKVKDTLNLFEELYQKMLQEHKEKEPGKPAGHVNVKAAMILREKWVYKDEQFLGPVPGIEVGDQFQFRAELVVIGLHHQFSSGINYIKKDGKLLATSIVASGRYANETQSPDVLIYSGQGGNPKIKNKKPEDQKLERGNLALKNSMDEGTPVRVIRGRKHLKASERSLAYVYDGLYIVSSWKPEKGPYGKSVFMFKLDRLPGQPRLIQEIARKLKKSKARLERCVIDDVSESKERMPIRAMNAIDNTKPPPFIYITNMIYPKWYDQSMPNGCNCTDGCSDSRLCSCVIKNGREIPFNNYGAIVRAKTIVYECGFSCKCPPSCMNRSSQHGIRYQLEIFKSESRGWGVRSRNFISSRSFICEYVGELLREKEAEERMGSDEYLFDIGNRGDEKEEDNFTIDAAQYGNVGRFINHSCSPNLYAQDVFYDHDDKRMPHVMLFASKNIPPLRELTCDYNYKIDHVRDVNGNIKKKNCYCGARRCTGRMY